MIGFLPKECTGCLVVKDVSCFQKDKSTKDGYSFRCKDCLNAQHREYRNKRKDVIREQKKKSYDRNREKILERHHAYYLKNKERIREQAKKYREENKEKVRKQGRDLRNKNPEADRAKCRQYQHENRERLNADRVRRRKEDLNFRIRANMRSRLSTAIRSGAKGGSAVRDLGMDIDSFKIYLSQFFYPNPITGEEMTWENYGRPEGRICWDIDHIKPLVEFDLTDPDQAKIACHYLNLRPLWSTRNSSLGGKVGRMIQLC